MKRTLGPRYDDGPTERDTIESHDCIRARRQHRGSS